ncbi:SRPBCC family protein [Hufsiella ginkgonis]|uniref:Polyketide cyclase n=1 Tax=Hufsiella ginkgonis TaxID=2695274 RepID=A0A7K1Y1T4_9SPHI|nr:SRPBCC family protein [Hufsiella ginkgonis]MXV17077.1 polyketide cyclase [Hufsiella ginkgonis]
METTGKTAITVESTVNAPVEKVWEIWGEPEHIKKWNSASDDWHTPHAENDLRTGGKFLSTMAAKDGSFSFDFSGVYDEVVEHKSIAYSMADGRKVSVTFTPEGDGTKVTEIFDAETQHSVEMQKAGWQSILDNFKRYTEAQA